MLTTPDPVAAPAARANNAAAASSSARRGDPAAEAARHTLLRRLAPALKHDMVVNLQAVAMLTEMLAARLERGSAGTEELQAAVAKLNRLSRDAVADCLKVATWLDPAEDDAVPLPQAVGEAAALLSGNMNFHGFLLSNQVEEDSVLEVSRATARSLIAAALMLLMDTAAQPCEIVLRSEITAGDALLSLFCVPLEQAPPHAAPQETAPLPIDWADVQAMAAAGGATAARDGEQIQLRLPRAQVTSPVRMAPV